MKTFILAAAATLVVPALPLRAQVARDTTTDSTARHGAAPPAPLFTAKDAFLGLAFAGTTVALLPVDQRLARHLQNEGAQANRFFRRSATGLEVFTSPGAYIIGGSLYAVGRVGKFGRVADLGWHGTEAMIFAQGVTTFLKGTLGRARPYATADTNAANFGFFRGFTKGSDYQSFPSGHTTTAFAAAAAVTAETGRWWPRSTVVVGPLMYGGATLVGLSRMYHNKHWASDVALGAAIGTFSGMKVVQYSHAHPDNFIDRVILRTAVLPDGRGGLAVVWTMQAP